MFHVDLDADADVPATIQHGGEIGYARFAIDGEPKLSQLQGHGRVDPTIGDGLDCLEVLLGRLVGAGEVGDSLAEQVENPADPLAVQLNRCRDAILEGGTRDVAVHHLPDQGVGVGHLFQSAVLSSPDKQTVYHWPSLISSDLIKIDVAGGQTSTSPQS